MITIEGITFKARIIPKNTIMSAWNSLSKEPLPKVAAFQLEDGDFDHVMKLMKCADDERREIEEWGKVLSTRGIDACVYNADESADVDYIVLIRENPYHGLGEILKHELSHIVRGDL